MTFVELLNLVGIEGAQQESPVVAHFDGDTYDIREVTLDSETGNLVLDIELRGEEVDDG